jgi:hypothetical protein
MKLTSLGKRKDIRFVVATPYSQKEFTSTDYYQFKIATLNRVIHTIEYNNIEGLPALYNKYLTDTYKNEYIIFVHDDLLISDLFVVEKIYKSFLEYDIIGLAGTSKIVNTNTPAWHMMAGWYDPAHGRKHSLGEVAHFHNEDITTSVYGPTKGRALLLDGAFLGVNVEKVLETNCRFDTDFKFHFYDLSFCLRANEAKLKMGIIQLFCIHRGLGDSIASKEWIDNSSKFLKKYFNK